MNMTLSSLFDKYGSDKNSVHSYGPTYDKLFKQRRLEKLRILEIGVQHGNSLRAFVSYFSNAEIYGCDNWRSNEKPEIENVVLLYADSSDPSTLPVDAGPFDIIIDDASHLIFHQVANFARLWPSLNKGGIYIIEDIADIEHAKRLVRQFNNGWVIDLRSTKNRYDDILVIFTNN